MEKTKKIEDLKWDLIDSEEEIIIVPQKKLLKWFNSLENERTSDIKSIYSKVR